MSQNVKKEHYLAIASASYLLVAIVLSITGRFSIDSEAIGYYLGAGFGLMLIPLITIRLGGAVSGWGVFIALGLFYIIGSLDTVEEGSVVPVEPFKFQGMNCEYSVIFPGRPEIKVYTHPEAGDYEVALWTGTNSEESTVLRTECIPIQLGLVSSNAKDFLLGQLAIFAQNNGLSSVEYRFNNEVSGPTGYARGIKYVQEKPVTYSILVIAGKNSLITLYAGGLSEKYPSKEITPFLNSIKKAK